MYKFVRNFFLVVLALSFVGGLGFLVYISFIDKSAFAELDRGRLLYLLGAILLAFVRFLGRGPKKRSPAYYKNFYRDIIKDSFESDGRSMNELLKGIQFYNVDKFDRAVETLLPLKKNCRTLNEKFAVKLFLALSYSDGEDYENAELVYQGMIDECSADTTVFSNLGNLYILTGDYEKAKKTCARAIEFAPDNYAAYDNMSYACFLLGDYEGAVENCMKVLEIKDNYEPAFRHLYVVHSLLGNAEEAELYAKRAVAAGCPRSKLKESLEKYL